MSKADDLLDAFKENVGEWVCGLCNSKSNQPAATFREIKKMGYAFEEHSPGRWGKAMYCSTCHQNTSHYKLLKLEPEFVEKPRIPISPKDRKRILKLLAFKDAFTGATISSTPEIDHKVPWSRLEQDVDVARLSDHSIFNHFQLLTREHNLLKDRACTSCIRTNKRPPFMQIDFWYQGNEVYGGSCVGCGWYDGEKWRIEINKKLKP